VRIEGALGPASALADLLLRQDQVPVQRSDGPSLLRVDGFALALSDGRSATERSAALGEPVVLFDLALDFAACRLIALAAPVQAGDEHLRRAIGLFVLLGKRVSVLDDAPGLAVTRTVAMLVNEAADALHQGIAAADDIDAAKGAILTARQRRADGAPRCARASTIPCVRWRGAGAWDCRTWPLCCGTCMPPRARRAIACRLGCSARCTIRRKRSMAEFVRTERQDHVGIVIGGRASSL
jgi:hypothetical protein